VQKLVDDETLQRWRELDVFRVLSALDCYFKSDPSFRPVSAKGTERFYVNAAGRDWELLVSGPKFWDSRAQCGGGGAVDLVMHLFELDFKRAVRLLRKSLSADTAASARPASHSKPAFP